MSLGLSRGRRKILLWLFGLVLIAGLLAGLAVFKSAPSADLDGYWAQPQPPSEAAPDHSLWQALLDDYLVEDESGINLVDYEGIQVENDPRLDQYIDALAGVDPRGLSRADQMAYWINLYNALTIRVIVDSYPVESIMDLGESLLSRGPWDDTLIEVTERPLTLNDIEHRILRPIFDDYRIHFAVNCASIGCPNLSPLAFTAASLEQQLNRLTEAFLAHPRGLQYRDGELLLSSIFQWYAEDFGQDDAELLQTLANHVTPSLAETLRAYTQEIKFAYEWRLNGL